MVIGSGSAMSRFLKIGVLLVILLVVGFGLWQTLPYAANLLPGRIRQYVPEQVLALVISPLPTALPVPAPDLSVTDDLHPLEILPAVTPTLVPAPTAASKSNSTLTQTPSDSSPAALPTPLLTVSPGPSPTPSVPAVANIDGLYVIPQKFNNCGPTNLTIVLNYYDVEVDQFDVAAVVRQNYEDRNVSPEELAGYAREHAGLGAAVFRGGDLGQLKQLLAAGYPVIIEKGLIPDEHTGWIGHYLTLYGYDDGKGAFLALDTFLGPWNEGEQRWEPYEKVAQYWLHFNNTFLVAYRPEQEAQVKELLGPAMTDTAAMWTRAAGQAQEAISADERNAFAWFNLGTALTSLAELTGDSGYYDRAVAAFDRARLIGLPPRMLWYQFQPYEAYLAVGRVEDVLVLTEATLASQGGSNVEETYLYQGYALLAQGDVDGATAAYRRATELNPNFVAAREALTTVNDS
jgi:hypothetical protein